MLIFLRGRWRFLTIVCGGLVLLASVVVWQLLTAPAADVPPVSPSPFVNTDPQVGFVGMETCRKCHEDAHESYSRTAHSQALGKVDLSETPPDGEFDDPTSERHYRIYREQGELRHAESITGRNGKSLILADWPVSYVIGSGRFSRSYLIEQDGCLFESPATWYAARPGWSLSPGFAHSQAGFQRPVELRCLTCHAGRVESVDRSPQRVTFHAQAVDCERCHGPGAAHVARRETAEVTGIDTTIVNPAHLDRQRREDLCAQCHLHSAATVELRERTLQQFRPGQLLADYAAFYSVQAEREQMEVVGHVEQMRLSECYRQAPTLTCTTCHDPHQKPDPAEAAATYRQKCLDCHARQSCTESLSKREVTQPADNCVTCHMPSSPTEIPHFAFTHHRIGIHKPSPLSHSTVEPGELRLLSGNPDLSPADQDRNLGLAYLQFSDAPGQSEHAETYRDRARQLLESARVQQLEDVEVDAGLARLYWGVDSRRAIQHAERVAAKVDCSPDAWATACFTLGSSWYALDNPRSAAPWLEHTARIRPTADVWTMLSDCRQFQGDLVGARNAAQRAAKLAPDRPRYLEHYIRLLEQSGDQKQAAELRPRLKEIFDYRQRIDRAAAERSGRRVP